MKKFLALVLAVLLLDSYACFAQSVSPDQRPRSAVNSTRLAQPLPISQGGTGGNASTVFASLATNQANLLPKWRAALARVIGGTGNAKIYTIGDSTFVGYNNGAANNMTTSPPAMLANMFNAAGINAFFNNKIGKPSITDGRLTLGSWTTGGWVIGGNSSFLINATTATPLSFCTSSPVNSANLIWYTTGTSAQFSYTIDSGSPTTITTGTSTGIHTTTITPTLGTHCFNMNWVAGTVGYVGWDATDTTKNGIDVISGGAISSTSAIWSAPGNGTYTGVGTITYLAQDLTIIDIGINDWCAAVPVSTYMANMQTIITQAKTVGDVLLVTPIPTQPGASCNASTAPSNVSQQAYVNALYVLAAKNNIPLVDLFSRWQSYAASSAFYTGGVHPLQNGIADMAEAIFSALVGTGQSTQSFGGVSPRLASYGTFVCTSGGAITVADTNILATSQVLINMNTVGGTVTTNPSESALTAGTSFVAQCAALDTSTYNYWIYN